MFCFVFSNWLSSNAQALFKTALAAKAFKSMLPCAKPHHNPLCSSPLRHISLAACGAGAT